MHERSTDMDLDKRRSRFPINLYCSLMLLSFIPFLYTLVRTNLIVNSPTIDGLGIAGHMEWFDLINETIQAFLIVPLYALFNGCIKDKEKFPGRILQTFLIVNTVYILFSVAVYVRCNAIVLSMVSDRTYEVTEYLRLETIGFIIANVVSFVNVLFVVLEKSFYIYVMIILRTIFTVIGDFCLIPKLGVNGAAYSSIAVNVVCVVLCLIAVWKEKLFAAPVWFDGSLIGEYFRIGIFSGFQVALDNIVYSAIVCKMVNEVEEQGNYWVANNIIWGLLLIPIGALAEIIKKDCKEELTSTKMKHYNTIIIATFMIWLCLIPLLNPFLKYVMGIDNYSAIKRILLILMPFYLAYCYTVLFDNILIGYGKTLYCFAISVIVNLVYYPILYALVSKGILMPDMTFICMMFGFGMVIHLCCSVVCFIMHKSRSCDHSGSESKMAG